MQTVRTTPSANEPPAKADTHALLTGTKQTKPEANYRAGNNDAKICHTCKNYQEPSQDLSPCLRVVGIVQSAAVCDLWTEKSAVRPDTTGGGEGQHKVEIKIHTGSSGSSINRSITEKPNY